MATSASKEKILRKIGCGYCNTGHHESCVVEVTWYDKIWVCGCKECKNVID